VQSPNQPLNKPVQPSQNGLNNTDPKTLPSKPASPKSNPAAPTRSGNGSTVNSTKTVLTRPEAIGLARLPNHPSGTASHAITKKPMPPHFDRPPVLHNPGNGWRSGYYPYESDWLDDWFAYAFYCFDYNPDNCVASPWYYYPDMPAYVDSDRISQDTVVVDSAGFQSFDWRSPTVDASGSDAYYLDTAIGELVSAYEDQDAKALATLVPTGYQVSVSLDGGDGYDLSSDDFHDLMLDNITTTKTERFTIMSVGIKAGEAKVQAMHTFYRPDGTTTQLLHTYILDRTPNGYVIASIEVTQPATPF